MPDMTLLPLAGAIGAEIAGVDLSRPLDNVRWAAVHQAFLDHQVIFFRDQTLTPDQLKAFARRFGELDIHPQYKPIDGHPEVLEFLKDVDATKNVGGIWHSDVTFYERPALGSMLYALEIPVFGGDTMFANQYLAYETLSDGLKRLLGGLKAVHSDGFQSSPEAQAAYNEKSSTKLYNPTTEPTENVHPVVRTHPETGRKALYVNPVFTVRFDGMTAEESKPLLDHLCRHAVRPEFTCRFRWSQGAVAMWDNRCTQHFAINDYNGHRRRMHRVTVRGERPV